MFKISEIQTSKTTQKFDKLTFSKARRKLREGLPFFMGKFDTSSKVTHPLAKRLAFVITHLYRGIDEIKCSEEFFIESCAQMLNDRFAEIPQELLELAIQKLYEIDSKEELLNHHIPTHLKNSVENLCGGKNFKLALHIAMARLEKVSPPKQKDTPPIIWKIAGSYSSEARKEELANVSPSEIPDLTYATIL